MPHPKRFQGRVIMPSELENTEHLCECEHNVMCGWCDKHKEFCHIARAKCIAKKKLNTGKPMPVIDLETGIRYKSMKEVKRKLGVTHWTINRHCKRYANGLKAKWRFAEPDGD